MPTVFSSRLKSSSARAVSEACPGDVNDTCYVNNGKVTYEGIEGEGTYAFDNLLGMDVQGLSMFANGALMRSVASTGLWEPNAPYWTAALGVLFQNSSWRFSLIDKYTGQEYNDASDLKAYGDLMASIAYDFSNYEWESPACESRRGFFFSCG